MVDSSLCFVCISEEKVWFSLVQGLYCLENNRGNPGVEKVNPYPTLQKPVPLVVVQDISDYIVIPEYP